MGRKKSELTREINEFVNQQLDLGSKVSGTELASMFCFMKYKTTDIEKKTFNNVNIKISRYLNELYKEGVLEMEELTPEETSGNIPRKNWWRKEKIS